MRLKPSALQARRARLREQYEVERELADRLRQASRIDRRRLYTELYDEFYRRIPNQPQLEQAKHPNARRGAVKKLLRLLQPFLHDDTVFLEIGPGDCALSAAVAVRVKRAYAVDVSTEVTKRVKLPSNLSLIISDGSSIPVPKQSITLAFSNQLMEHLHPDDAKDQLANIFAALKPGGKYYCITPHRLSGPHDVSKYFSDVAQGFHLHEYTFQELRQLFLSAGFQSIQARAALSGYSLPVPASLVILYEALLALLPQALRCPLARSLPIRMILGIYIIGVKIF